MDENKIHEQNGGGFVYIDRLPSDEELLDGAEPEEKVVVPEHMEVDYQKIFDSLIKKIKSNPKFSNMPKVKKRWVCGKLPIHSGWHEAWPTEPFIIEHCDTCGKIIKITCGEKFPFGVKPMIVAKNMGYLHSNGWGENSLHSIIDEWSKENKVLSAYLLKQYWDTYVQPDYDLQDKVFNYLKYTSMNRTREEASKDLGIPLKDIEWAFHMLQINGKIPSEHPVILPSGRVIDYPLTKFDINQIRPWHFRYVQVLGLRRLYPQYSSEMVMEAHGKDGLYHMWIAPSYIRKLNKNRLITIRGSLAKSRPLETVQQWAQKRCDRLNAAGHTSAVFHNRDITEKELTDYGWRWRQK